MGGSIEVSAKYQVAIMKGMLLMPAGVITMLIFRVPFEFIANLGFIMLAGIIMYNAAILAMIALTRQVFWGPMAVSIMGGLVIATLLTCFFLPALYAAWFKVKEA
jgi:multidrug efflux pump